MRKILIPLFFLSQLAHAINMASAGAPFCASSGTFFGNQSGVMGCYTPAGGGNFTGAASSVTHDLVGFADTSGTVAEDSGILASSVCTLTGSQNLTNKTVTAPTLSGIATTPYGKWDTGATAQTTTTSLSTIYTLALSDNTNYLVEARISGRKSDGSKRASFILGCDCYRDGGGSATMVSLPTVIHSVASDNTYAATCVASGNNLLIQANGNTSSGETVNWKLDVYSIGAN